MLNPITSLCVVNHGLLVCFPQSTLEVVPSEFTGAMRSAWHVEGPQTLQGEWVRE